MTEPIQMETASSPTRRTDIDGPPKERREGVPVDSALHSAPDRDRVTFGQTSSTETRPACSFARTTGHEPIGGTISVWETVAEFPVGESLPWHPPPSPDKVTNNGRNTSDLSRVSRPT